MNQVIEVLIAALGDLISAFLSSIITPLFATIADVLCLTV
jgi:hypothetical protein